MRSIKSTKPHSESRSDQDAINKYMNLDEDALMAELMRSVQAAKENGTFDQERIRSFIAVMSPRLSPAQREKLKALTDMISE